MVANRLPSVVACAATLCERPAITVVSCSAASRASRARVATVRSRSRVRDCLHLQLLDVLGQVARGHPLVDVLVTGERAELLDPRLHVVPGHPLARGDRLQVDLVDDVLVGLDHAVGHVDAEVALRLQHGDPQLPLEHDLVLRRPDRGEVGAGVPGGEDVGDAHVVQFPTGGRGEDSCQPSSAHGRPRPVRRRCPRNAVEPGVRVTELEAGTHCRRTGSTSVISRAPGDEAAERRARREGVHACRCGTGSRPT